MAESLHRRVLRVTGAAPPLITSASDVVVIHDIEPKLPMKVSGIPVIFPADAKYEPPKYDRTLNREQRRKLKRES